MRSFTLVFSTFSRFIFQLSELEQRVVEAETRAEDAEEKVRPTQICLANLSGNKVN